MPYIKKIVSALFPALILALLLSASASLCGWGTERTSFMVQYGLSDVISLYALLKAFS